MKSNWVVLWSLWAARLVRQPSLTVRVSTGLVRGSLAPDGSHINYLGLPYASYQYRFQASKPHPGWKGIFEATEERIRCSQRFSNTWINGQEDCLTLNVYTPIQQTSEKLLPVMVFVHGGGFRDGSGSPFLYGPEYLIRHDVILVTMNYRLEVLGFLCLGIKDAPGNMGLKDQVQALRWVKENIKVFGGNPDKVTIFGESAGSASVLYHIVSPMSAGLFQGAILQSGSAISPWSLQFEPLKTASNLAKYSGFSSQDPYEIHKLFSKKSIEELLSARIPRIKGDVILSENVFVPCIENNLDEEQFLPDSPYNLITKGRFNKVPIIMGYNNAEGYMFVGKENKTTLQTFNFYGALPRDLEFSDEAEKVAIANRIQKQYFMRKENISNYKLIRLAKYEGDSGIVYPVTTTVELLSKSMKYPVYAYKFCYDGWMNLIKTMFKFWRYPGATHADDLFYLFKLKVTLPQTFLEVDIINKMTTMWTNFAKYGYETQTKPVIGYNLKDRNPTPVKTKQLPIKWRPIDPRKPVLQTINKEFTTEALWNDKDLRFWNETYSKHRRRK